MQPRTLLLKHIVLVSVAAMFFVASPSFAQQKGASSSEMKTKEVRVNGLTLHYIELGQGTPVVLVHGTLEDYRTWDGQLDAFSKGYRLISYHGERELLESSRLDHEANREDLRLLGLEVWIAADAGSQLSPRIAVVRSRAAVALERRACLDVHATWIGHRLEVVCDAFVEIGYRRRSKRSRVRSAQRKVLGRCPARPELVIERVAERIVERPAACDDHLQCFDQG